MSDVFMPNVLKQKAVYWPPEGTTGGGATIYGEAVQIKCRWEDISEEYTDTAGDTKISNSKVMVDRKLEVGGVLWLGALVDVPSSTDPMSNDGAYEIKKFNSVPSFNGKKFARTAIL
jgi:hypothetical protein